MAEGDQSDLPANITLSKRGIPYIKGDRYIFPGARNFIRFILFDPCSRPFWVYALTFLPAALEAFVSVVTITAADIIRDRARKIAPAGGTFPPGNPKRKAGSRVPDGKKPTHKTSAGGLAHLLRWTQPIEDIGLALLLYSAADRFFMRWQSLILSVPTCLDDLGSFQRSALNRSWNMLFAGGAANMPDLLQNSANWGNNAFVVGLPPGQYQFVFSATLTPTFPATYDAGIQVFHPGLTGAKITRSGLQAIQTGGNTSFIVQKNFIVTGFAGTTLGWQTYGATVPVGITCVNAHIVVTRLG